MTIMVITDHMVINDHIKEMMDALINLLSGVSNSQKQCTISFIVSPC